MSAPERRKAAAGGQAAFPKTPNDFADDTAGADIKQNGLCIYQRLFGRMRRGRMLDRGSLPTPLQYLIQRGLLKRKPRREWAAICCPSHKGGEERHPSLDVSLIDGHFKCHCCV